MPTTDFELDALFQLPLDKFTAARNTLAATLKEDGRDARPAQVKALQKPPLSAWVVNQLFWRHRKAFDAFIDAGERVRKAQATQLRSAARAKDANLRTTLAAPLQHPPPFGRHPRAPPGGHLTDDVQPPGFDVLASLTSAKGARGVKGGT